MQHVVSRRWPVVAVLFTSLSLGVLSVQAQKRPDFNGSWRLVIAQANAAAGSAPDASSAPAPGTVRRVTKGADPGAAAPGALGSAPPQLAMQLNDTSLIVKVPGRPDVMYTLDNKEKKSEVVTRGGKVEIAIKSRWDGAKIVTTETQKAIVEGELRMSESRLTRSIDKDGRLNVTMDVSNGPGSYKAVYAKAPSQP